MGCPEDLHRDRVVSAAEGHGCRNQNDHGQDDTFGNLPPHPAGLCGKPNHAANAEPNNKNPSQEEDCRHDTVIENHSLPRVFRAQPKFAGNIDTGILTQAQSFGCASRPEENNVSRAQQYLEHG
jgi:hypothetical protein